MKLIATRRLLVAVGVALAVLLAPTVASAAVHTGSITFAEPTNPASIGPPPPSADHVNEYEREILVRYDASAGTFTAEVEVWDPAYWGEHLIVRGETVISALGVAGDKVQALWFRAGPHCGESLEGPYGGAPAPGSLEGFIEATPERRVWGEVKLGGYTGSVVGTGSFNGQRFQISFSSSPAFSNQNWRCVSLGGQNNVGLDGYPARPTVVAHRAPAALLRTLTSTANAHHADGFNVLHQYLTNGRATNNGWADAEQRFRQPSNPVQRQRGIFIVFHVIGRSWHVVTYGSTASTGLCRRGKQPEVPPAVCHALKL